MSIPVHSTLFCINSKRDKFGNCYYAFRFVNHATGQQVQAKCNGGESNVYGIRREWNPDHGWDKGIQFFTEEKPIREFNALVKNWPYAGCNPEELVAFIRKNLNQKSGEK